MINEIQKVDDLAAACHNAAGKPGADSKWLPLWIHLIDTANMMEYLTKQWLSEHQIDLIEEEIDQEGDEHDLILRISRLLGLLHDLG